MPDTPSRDCCVLDDEFDRRVADDDRRDYKSGGPDKTTRLLLDALRERGVEGMTLLDIGGGVGVIQQELLAAGVSRAVGVDASSAYLEVALEEARRRGTSERVEGLHGDFVDLAPQVEPADIVTLHRVICCYRDMEALVDASAARTRRYYGLVYPHDRWWARAMGVLEGWYTRLFRRKFRFYIHRSAQVEAIAARHGLTPSSRTGTRFWQVVLFERS